MTHQLDTYFAQADSSPRCTEISIALPHLVAVVMMVAVALLW